MINLKIYCSFDSNNILTGWCASDGGFSTTETIKEIELTENEFNQLENNHPNCFKFDNGTLVFRKQEFFDELNLLKLEKLAFEEEKKAEEFSTIMNRLNV